LIISVFDETLHQGATRHQLIIEVFDEISHQDAIGPFSTVSIHCIVQVADDTRDFDGGCLLDPTTCVREDFQPFCCIYED
jgi:hypothetical protein